MKISFFLYRFLKKRLSTELYAHFIIITLDFLYQEIIQCASTEISRLFLYQSKISVFCTERFICLPLKADITSILILSPCPFGFRFASSSCRAGAVAFTPCAALNAYAFIAVGLAPYKSKIARDWPSTQVSSSSLLLFYPCMACSLRKVSLQ